MSESASSLDGTKSDARLPAEEFRLQFAASVRIVILVPVGTRSSFVRHLLLRRRSFSARIQTESIAAGKELITRFAVIHCRNDECGQNSWVPENRLGTRGRCPNCGRVIATPAFVPRDELVEGPAILQDLDRVAEPLEVGVV